MRWKDASLGGSLTDQEEVIQRAVFIADNVTVDNRTAWRVLDGDRSAIVLRCVSNVLLEESLVDSLIDHNESDLGL